MHISLDQAIGRQPRLNRVGQSLLNIASGASAAYSLRSLTGDEPKAVRIRRDGDNEERDFTTAEIGNEAADWTNGKQETTLPADVATSAAAYSLRKVKSDYTGPAVRIRRTSDDIDADVAFDTNDKVSNDSIVTEVLSGNQSTLSQFLTQNINKLDIQAATGGLVGNVTNVTSTGFDFSVNNEGAVGQQKLFAPSDATTGIYNITFDAVLNSGSLTGITMARVGASENIVEGSNSITLSMTPDVSDGAIFVRTPSTAVANVSITNITLTQTFSGAAVAIWYDQSGNSRNATQISDDNQPLISEDGNLLTAGITFDGTDDFLATDQSVITQSSAGSFSYFGVSTIATDEAGYIFGSAGNGTTVGSSIYAQNDSKFSLSNGNIVQRDNITRSSGENLVSACYTGSRANLRVNGGGTSVTESTYNFNANSNFTIGNREDGSSAAARVMAGSIKEIIAYDSDQTNNRFKIESNINNYYTIYSAAQNGFVNTWYDQSGNSKNATASADADEPEIVKNGNLLTDPEGRPEIQFDGSSHHFNVNFDSDLDQPNTIVMVHQSDTTTLNKNRFFDREGTSDLPRTLFASVNSNYRMLAQSFGDTGVALDTNKTLVVALFNSSSSVLTKNGTASSLFNSGIQGINQNSEIGLSNSPLANYEGTMQEFIIYNANQSSVQTALETNIANHYGITLS
jgi:hypothetical protein